MRTIKFRAWDNMLCEMFEVYTLSKYEVYAIQKETEDMYKLNLSDCELMQFTGLLDKKGTEIYEGDIVDYDLEGFIERHKIIFETKQCAYFLFPLSKKARARNLTYSAKNDCIVVGNIFQHHHLLEANHD